MSIWKKIGGFLKKAAPVVGAIASVIPGIGPAVSKGIDAITGVGRSPEEDGMASQNMPSNGQVVVSDKAAPSNTSSLITGAIAGGLNYLGQQNTNVANAQQAQKQMDFQEKMSNTSYQRGVADIRAAGLNPLLAYSNGGASTPGGATAEMGNSLGAGANSAFSAAQTIVQLQSAMAGIDKMQADTDVSEAQARFIGAQTRTENNRPENVFADTVFKRSSAGKTDSESRGQELANQYLKESMSDRLREISSGADLRRWQSQAEKYGLSEKKGMSDFWNSAVGHASPYLRLGMEGVNSASSAISSIVDSVVGALPRKVYHGKLPTPFK